MRFVPSGNWPGSGLEIEKDEVFLSTPTKQLKLDLTTGEILGLKSQGEVFKDVASYELLESQDGEVLYILIQLTEKIGGADLMVVPWSQFEEAVEKELAPSFFERIRSFLDFLWEKIK